MKAKIDQLADAVVTHLNGAPAGTFALAVAGEKSYRPNHKLEELSATELFVPVVPVGREMTRGTRASIDKRPQIHVGVQRQCDPDDVPAFEQLLLTAEQVAEYLAPRDPRLPGYTAASWETVQHDPLFVPDHLYELRVFTSVIRVSYRIGGGS